ncbi:MAG: agmatinase [Acidobacteria bacterium]|nr:MAG: agmatinase [Acidobacteriota bacterium]REJ99456.1 MAG: agmatinase [Acidobacteriota bacterium]
MKPSADGPSDEVLGDLESGDVALVGVPYDADSSHLRGAAEAPQAIRAQLFRASANPCSELGVDLSETDRWRDLGDLGLANESGAAAAEDRRRIESLAAAIARQGARPLLLGGDHSITYAAVRALARRDETITVVQFDAHPDLYDELDGNRFSHACPFARLLEEDRIAGLLQIGVRTFNPHQRSQAERFGVDSLEMKDFRDGADLTLDPPLYVTIDLDVLDPAHAPAVSHPEPGGLTTRDLIDLIHALPGPIVGADLVELNPRLDDRDRSATVAAKVLKELLAQMLLEP